MGDADSDRDGFGIGEGRSRRPSSDGIALGSEPGVAGNQGRAAVDPGHLMRFANSFVRLSVANPLWGAPRIHGELLKLGMDVGQTTVAKYMAKRRRPLSQGWRTFVLSHPLIF